MNFKFNLDLKVDVNNDNKPQVNRKTRALPNKSKRASKPVEKRVVTLYPEAEPTRQRDPFYANALKLVVLIGIIYLAYWAAPYVGLSDPEAALKLAMGMYKLLIC